MKIRALEEHLGEPKPSILSSTIPDMFVLIGGEEAALVDDLARDDEDKALVAAIQFGNADDGLLARLHRKIAVEKRDRAVWTSRLCGPRRIDYRNDPRQPGLDLDEVLVIFFDVLRAQVESELGFLTHSHF